MIAARFNSKSASVICTALLLIFTATAWLAVRTKSPAYDEPYHAVSAWVQLRHFDFRLDNEDPPLWQYWASLPNGKSALKADFSSDIWQTIPQSLAHQWYWGVQTLYRTPGNDPDKLIAHCRIMMLMVAVGLGALICVWAWKIGGPIAAITAVFLFCLDPNFLAHSPLMKNDVAFAMSMFALAFALWKGGEELTASRLMWIVLLCIATLTVKFSGLVAVLLVPLVLGIRALMPSPWAVLGRIIPARRDRLMIAASVTLLAMLCSYAGIWTVYGFRFRPTPQRDVWLDLGPITEQIRVRSNASPDGKLPLPARAALFADRHHLLPQAFVGGFLFTYANGLIRFAYANGKISPVGWWWYFPFAILVKTPVATLLAMAASAIIALRSLMGRVCKRDTALGPVSRVSTWTFICLLAPIAMFLIFAMAQNLNIGVRHVLAIYPFLFVSIGVTTATLWQSRGIKTRLVIGLLGLALALETFRAFPNFIAFFNVIATGTSSKLELLGDSNLDWGQDLPLLAQWQQAHRNTKLYLCYFGYADPHHYRIEYIPLPGGYHYDSHPHFPEETPFEPGVVAISATNLQGILLDPQLRMYYRAWALKKPIAVLGDSIYLYEK